MALAAINFSGQAAYLGEDALPNIRPVEQVFSAFRERIDRIPEVAAVRKLIPLSNHEMFRADRSPFLWGATWLCKGLRFSPLAALVLLSNLFFVLLLLETFQLLNRMVTEQMAGSVCILLILWPASYEMSLGSPLALTCYLVVRSIRCAMDDGWLAAGISLAVLQLAGPIGSGLMVLVVYLFLYFCRGRPMEHRFKSGAMLLVPLILAILWRKDSVGSFQQVFSGSAAGSLFAAVKEKQVGWTFAYSQLGQTITLAFLALGTLLGCLQTGIWVHRVATLGMLVLLVLYSSYGTLASRAPMAGLCLAGLVSTRLRLIPQYLLFSLSAREVFVAFS